MSSSDIIKHRHEFEFISVDTWYLFSDIIIDAKYKRGNPFYEYKDELNNISNKKNPVIFVKTDFFYDYCDIISGIDFNFILITASNDDHCLPEYIFDYSKMSEEEIKRRKNYESVLNNKCLLKWYLKNPSYLHSKMVCLPLGNKSQWKTTRFLGEDQTKNNEIFRKYCLEPCKNLKDENKKTNLLYLNFSNTTNNPFFKEHRGIRPKCKYTLLKNGFEWCVSKDFKEYISELHTYKFVAAPPGRGILTHRLDEALTCGCIPIVISSYIDILYEDLPVLIIDDWSIVTPEFLEEQYLIMKDKQYKFEKLYPKYWIDLIREI